jgi:hypothetical protein
MEKFAKMTRCRENFQKCPIFIGKFSNGLIMWHNYWEIPMHLRKIFFLCALNKTNTVK